MGTVTCSRARLYIAMYINGSVLLGLGPAAYSIASTPKGAGIQYIAVNTHTHTIIHL